MTCKDCFHYQVCGSFGFVLDPLHGGVTCCDFKTKTDVVEVVRCKDCKYFLHDTDYCEEHNAGYCAFDDTIKARLHFCSLGIKKEGAEE